MRLQLPDYDFSGLSTRSFEHVVQALAMAVLGPRVTVFGDGQDGGRDATFDGPALPGEGLEWSGYGVIQAKYKQRLSGDTKADGDWAVEQLRKELAEYDWEGANRRLPEYYIFATNVVLTPYPEAGGKDRVSRELETWAERHRLRGWAIWDYDQLCRFLDTYEGVRRTFAAWTTPGDVLAALTCMVEGLSPDFASIAVQYLQKELRRDLYANLQQAGDLNEGRPVPLSQVFVDLPVSDASSMEAGQEWVSLSKLPVTGLFLENAIHEASVPLAAKGYSKRDGSGAGVDKQSARRGRIVLLGGPGQGKTTVGQYLCQLFRVRILNDLDSAMLEPQAREGCALITEMCTQDGTGLPGCKRFPIRVILSDYAAELANDADLPLVGYITKLFKARTEQNLDQGDVLSFLQAYPFLLVLDGLDEVPASSNRSDLVHAIVDFEADIAVKEMDAMILVTTRPQGYSEDLSPRFYGHQVLTPLKRDDALAYGKKLTRLRYGADPERVARIIGRLEFAAQHRATRRLMQSPLQVTIMTFLVDQVGHPPEERWDLFHQYYELICRREVAREIESSTVIREYQQHIDKIHRMYGLLLQSESERSGGTRSRLPLEQFEDLVRFLLKGEGFVGDRLQEVLRAIVTAAANRLVFLVGVEEGQVGFEIRSLQEFMAGEALLDGSDRMVQLRLETIAGSSNWRNVFLFAAGKIFKEIPHLRTQVVAICTALNDDPDDPARQLLMSGSQLALDLLAEGASRKSPLFAGQLTRLALRLLISPIRSSGRLLAEVCTRDTQTIYVDELKRLIQFDAVTSREAWACLTRLVDLGFVSVDKWYEYIHNRSHLLDDPQFFWAAAALVDDHKDVLAELASRLFSTSPEQLLRHLDYGAHRVPEVFNHNRSDLWPETFDRAMYFIEAKNRPDELILRLRLSDLSMHLYLNSCRPDSAVGGGLILGDEGSAPSWRFVDAAMRYSALGTPEALASLVECARDQFSNDTPYPLTPLGDLPWPAEACLESAAHNGSYDEIAHALRSGKMGSLDEWLTWEDAWKQSGLGWTSIPSNHDVLPFVKDHWLGAPAMAVHGFEGQEPPLHVLWDALTASISVAAQINDPAGRSAVVSLVTDQLYFSARKQARAPKLLLSANRLSLLRQMIEILGLQSATEAVLRLLARIDVTSSVATVEDVDEYVRLANDVIVNQVNLGTPIFDDDAIALFREAITNDPTLSGLLVPISRRASEPNLTFSPFDVTTHRRRMLAPITPKDEWALLLIDVRQSGLANHDMRSIARLFERFDPDWLESLVMTLSALSGDTDVEAVLVNLCRELQQTNGGHVHSVAVLHELAEAVRKRTTRLWSGDEWERLGLPRRVVEIRS